MFFLDFHLVSNWVSVIPTLAFIVSIAALRTNRLNAKKNIRLSIQQAIFKPISEKAKDCNALWEAETDRSYENATHFKDPQVIFYAVAGVFFHLPSTIELLYPSRKLSENSIA
jgi:hypothetical protein